MWPDRVSNTEPLTYESGVLPTALRSPAVDRRHQTINQTNKKATKNGKNSSVTTQKNQHICLSLH